MGPDDVREFCLDLPGAIEDFPFGDQVSVFTVADKIFAITALDGVPLEVTGPQTSAH